MLRSWKEVLFVADFKKYDELKAKKEDFFRQGAAVLEGFLANNPNGNNDVFQQLNNIFLAIGEVDKAKKYKAMIKQ